MTYEEENYKPYIEILKKWQQSINLISNSDINNIYERHIDNSIELSQYLKSSFNTNIKIMDVGSGAGFPGMILAIEGFKNITLIESNHKKTAFLNAIKNLYQLNNVTIINDRVENIKESNIDIITSRAFKSIKETFEKTKNSINQNTNFILLKGSNVNQEIKEAENYYKFQHKLIKNSQSNGYIIHIKML